MSFQSLPSFTSVFGEDFKQSTILIAKEYEYSINNSNISTVNTSTTMSTNMPLYNSGKLIKIFISSYIFQAIYIYIFQAIYISLSYQI